MYCPRCGMMLFGPALEGAEVCCGGCGYVLVLREHIPGISDEELVPERQPWIVDVLSWIWRTFWQPGEWRYQAR